VPHLDERRSASLAACLGHSTMLTSCFTRLQFGEVGHIQNGTDPRVTGQDLREGDDVVGGVLGRDIGERLM